MFLGREVDDAKEMEEGQKRSALKEASTTPDRKALGACSVLGRRHCGILRLLHLFSLFCLLLPGIRVPEFLLQFMSSLLFLLPQLRFSQACVPPSASHFTPFPGSPGTRISPSPMPSYRLF